MFASDGSRKAREGSAKIKILPLSMSLFPCSVLNICPSLVSTRLAACARPSIRGNEQNDGHETRWRSWKEKEQKPFVVCKLLSSFSLTKSLEHASENFLLLPQPQKEVTTVPTLLPKCQGNRIKHLPYRAARQRNKNQYLTRIRAKHRKK